MHAGLACGASGHVFCAVMQIKFIYRYTNFTFFNLAQQRIR